MSMPPRTDTCVVGSCPRRRKIGILQMKQKVPGDEPERMFRCFRSYERDAFVSRASGSSIKDKLLQSKFGLNATNDQTSDPQARFLVESHVFEWLNKVSSSYQRSLTARLAALGRGARVASIHSGIVWPLVALDLEVKFSSL